MTKKQFNAPLYVVQYANTIIAAFATGVAALAFHKKNNRIYLHSDAHQSATIH